MRPATAPMQHPHQHLQHVALQATNNVGAGLARACLVDAKLVDPAPPAAGDLHRAVQAVGQERRARAPWARRGGCGGRRLGRRPGLGAGLLLLLLACGLSSPCVAKGLPAGACSQGGAAVKDWGVPCSERTADIKG